MSERLAQAEAALKAGRGVEAIEHIVAALEENPAQSAQVYRTLLVQLYNANRFEEGAAWGDKATQRYPKEFQLWNVRGVMLRQLQRHTEALAVLETAEKLAPQDIGVLSNKGNVLSDMGEAARAETVFLKLTRMQPRNSEFQRLLGRAMLRQGKRDQALVRYRQATSLKKDNIDAWLDHLNVLIETQQTTLAEQVTEKSLAANPGHPRLLEAKTTFLRQSNQLRRAEAFLQDLLPTHEEAAWLHYQLGGTIGDYARDRGNIHLRRAVELAPERLDYRMALIESLERTRSGDEGANIEEAYQLLRSTITLIGLDKFSSSHLKIAFEVFIRVVAFDELEQLGDARTLGRAWASSGRHTALLKLLAHVKTLDDRYELLEQHRMWGRDVEAHAAKHPIRHSRPRAPDGKIRLGFMSSDLRRHPVGYFALPLFEHVDPRFEIYCYSFYQGEKADGIQMFFESKSTAYRWKPEMGTRDAAQMIADDQLDMLFELGGTTHMNKLDVMAYRPAPKQASWLGYPHSAGLSTVDYLVCDEHNVPPRRDLLVEEPLMMPRSWIALGRMVFSEGHVIEPGLPEERAGRITFGTANNPHKYNRQMLQLWAEVLQAVPDSRFLFIRPEGGAASFVRNLREEFSALGVAPDRIQFHTVRGAHMPVYNQLDISLDTLPLTGGTTTTEALWMGVPVVSLIGEAFFERLSASIMANSNIGDLATTDRKRFVEIAAGLAADPDRRRELRANLRAWMSQGPLGQTEQFAADFYDMVARTVRPQG